jgi:hypothetical protein
VPSQPVLDRGRHGVVAAQRGWPRLLDELELEGLVAAAFGQGGQIPFDGDFLVDLNLDPTDYVITVDIGIW